MNRIRDNGFVPPKNTKEGSDWHAQQREQASGSTGPTCLTGETRILVPGGWREISELVRGDEVLCPGDSGHLVERRLLKVREFEASRVLRIDLGPGARAVRATPLHTFRTEAGWRYARQLVAGDRVVCLDHRGIQAYRQVVRVEREANPEPVFNIYPEQAFQYIAEGCLSHSFSFLRGLRMAWGRWSSFPGGGQALAWSRATRSHVMRVS